MRYVHTHTNRQRQREMQRERERVKLNWTAILFQSAVVAATCSSCSSSPAPSSPLSRNCSWALAIQLMQPLQLHTNELHALRFHLPHPPLQSLPPTQPSHLARYQLYDRLRSCGRSQRRHTRICITTIDNRTAGRSMQPQPLTLNPSQGPPPTRLVTVF